jgi:hypothetical protein
MDVDLAGKWSRHCLHRSRTLGGLALVYAVQRSWRMTAAQIEQALLQAPAHDRIRLAAQLIAIALADDDVLNPLPHSDGSPQGDGSDR